MKNVPTATNHVSVQARMPAHVWIDEKVSKIEIQFELSSQTLLHGFRRELPEPFFAMLPDLERKSSKGIYQSLIFTDAGNKQGKIFHGATILKKTL